MVNSDKRKSKKKRETSKLSIGSFALHKEEPDESVERELPPPPPPPPPPEPEEDQSQDEEASEEVSEEVPEEVSEETSGEVSDEASEEVMETPEDEPEEIEDREEAPEPSPEPMTPEEIQDPDSRPEDDKTEEDEVVQTDEAPKKPVVSKGETFNMCPICMGIIKHGLAMLVCRCHKVYHVSCGKRLAHCPNCESGFSDDMIVGKEEELEDIKVDYESHEVPKLQLTPEDKLELLEERLILGEVSEEVYRELKTKYESEREFGSEPEDEFYRCPSCGNMVDGDAQRCSCGAVFSGEVGFLCPECGRVISFDSNTCNHCGVRFSESSDFSCPSCGRILARGTAECPCGTKFSDALVEGFNCPECGKFLESDASACDNCGVSFEEAD